MKRAGIVFVAAMGILMTVHEAVAGTHYVSTTGASLSPYTNWAMAATNIQAAINTASDGETVCLANGTYKGAGNRGLTWTNRHLIITSDSGNELNPACIIDAELLDQVFVMNGTGQTTNDIIQGLTIQNGKSLWAYTGEVNNYDGGGGIFMNNVSPRIRNCIFRWCKGQKSKTNGNYADGGAISIRYGAPIIEYCRVWSNETTHTGAGIHNFQADATIRNCDISYNLSPACYGGGGLAYVNNSVGTVEGCRIAFNKAAYYGLKGGFGAAIIIMNGSPTIRNCTIVSNRTDYLTAELGEGGGIRIRGLGPGGSLPTFYNNIIFGNVAKTNLEDFDMQYTNFNPDARCNLIGGGSTNFPKALTDNQWGVNPLFVATNDFHLQAGTPCFNAGTNGSWTANATDLDGNPRVLYGRVDLGAYEKVMPDVAITATCGTNGTMSATGTVYVPYKSDTNFMIQANSSYGVSYVLTNGLVSFTNSSLSGPVSTNISFQAVTSVQAIDAGFRENMTSNSVPYTWFEGYGWTNDVEAMALTDADGDGYVNWQEYVTDTDPTNGGSVFQLAVSSDAGLPQLDLQQTSTGRDYCVYWKYAVTNVGWQSATNIPGNGGAVQLDVDTGPQRGLYKIGVRLR